MKPCTWLRKLMIGSSMAAAMCACRIEPPLHLADNGDVEARLGDVIVDVNVVWDIDANWRDGWWYGWDQEDIAQFGEIAYPEPTNFEARIFYLGRDSKAETYEELHKFTLWERQFRRSYKYGYHDLLIWSNIDSDDGTQTLIVNEEDPRNVVASTSRNISLMRQAETTHNQPEIFYADYLDGFHISDDISDYDFFDEERQVWVKQLHATLSPLVYIYLVQVAVYNNNGRITHMHDVPSISGLAKSVQVHTGHTSYDDATVTYDMRLKHDLPARDGKRADIFGGMLTTFGLCDMPGFSASRSIVYSGSRADLRNNLSLRLGFSNNTDSVYSFDVTSQMQRQAHGGVITIELDANDLPIPRPDPSGMGTGFEPTVVPQDSISHDFIM